MPIAVSPRSSARATISRGCEPPRRKEKLVVTASSAYAIIYILTRTNSGKQAVHVPTRRRGFAAVKAFTVEPEAMAFAVFDKIVIAGKAPFLSLSRLRGRERWGIAPPFLGDPFRTLRAGDVVSHPAPAQTPRRAFADERGDFGRFALPQQQHRTRFVVRN